ncbi:CheR family methyltransferase [Myxosarcina sp. GI1(2024)]
MTACSTGEEAYSLAISIDETLEESQQQIPIKIFATDIDRSALVKASEGIYPTSIANEIDSERLQKYFIARENSYQIVRKIRKKIIFSVHDLTDDAGFSRMHFISCRNVLIYLQPKLQTLVLRNLHFSLVAKGILFLGEAETAETLTREFKTLDRQWKIYQKRRDVKMPLGFQAKHRSAGATTRSCSIQPQEKLYFESIIEQSLDQLLAESQSMLLIVDRNRRLVHVCGNNAAKIFKIPDGKITTEASQMVVSALRLPLDTALRRAKAEQKPIAYTGIKLGQGDNTLSISLTVIPPNEPVADSSQPLLYYPSKQQTEQFWLVRIREEIPLPTKIVPEQFEVNDEAQRRNLELEQQLQLTRANLEALVEELDTANKEQQASNEELAAANKELQSTNEELHTLNSEYQAKIQELTELNNDIDNSTEQYRYWGYFPR